MRDRNEPRSRRTGTAQPRRPARTRRARDPEATREAIVAAAQAMMAEHGVVGITVSDVARRAHVNRGTAYQHFPTRDRLVAAVLAHQAARAKRMIDAAAPTSLNDRIDETIAYFARHPEQLRVSMFRVLAGLPQPARSQWKGYVAWVARFTAAPRGRRDVDAEVLAVIMLGGMMLWLLGIHGRTPTAHDLDRLARETKRLLLYGAVDPGAHAELVRAARSPSGRARRTRTVVSD